MAGNNGKGRKPTDEFDRPAGTPDLKDKTWPVGAEKKLISLRNKREAAKAKLEAAIDDRDTGMIEVARMGRQPSHEEKDRCVQIVRALLDIKYSRFVITQSANKMDKVIADAEQGKLWEDDEEIPDRQQYFKDIATKPEKPEPEPEPAGAS